MVNHFYYKHIFDILKHNQVLNNFLEENNRLNLLILYIYLRYKKELITLKMNVKN